LWYRTRGYDAGRGVFIQADKWAKSIVNPVGYHAYGYVQGNPVRFVDPFGEFYVSAEVFVSDQPAYDYFWDLQKSLLSGTKKLISAYNAGQTKLTAFEFSYLNKALENIEKKTFRLNFGAFSGSDAGSWGGNTNPYLIAANRGTENIETGFVPPELLSQPLSNEYLRPKEFRINSNKMPFEETSKVKMEGLILHEILHLTTRILKDSDDSIMQRIENEYNRINCGN
jgi:hypothetical protein